MAVTGEVQHLAVRQCFQHGGAGGGGPGEHIRRVESGTGGADFVDGVGQRRDVGIGRVIRVVDGQQFAR